MSDAPAPTITVAFFDRATDNIPKLSDLDRADLIELLTRHDERPTKDGPLFSPTIYRPGTTRANENVVAITLLVCDVDDGWPIAEAVSLIEGLGLEHILYTTYSHSPAKPKYRVVLFPRVPVPANEWAMTWAGLAELFRGHIDPGTKDLSRIFYLPSCPPGAPHEVRTGKGRALDPQELPEPVDLEDALARLRKQPLGAEAAEIARRLYTGNLTTDGWTGLLNDWIVDQLVAAGLSDGQIERFHRHREDVRHTSSWKGRANRVRKPSGKKLRLRRATLEKEPSFAEAARAVSASGGGPPEGEPRWKAVPTNGGHPSPEIPPPTIDPGQDFRWACRFLQGFAHFTRPENYAFVVLFVAQACVADILPACYYLGLSGPPSSGKTKVLKLVLALGGGDLISDCTESYLSRVLENGKLLGFDELDDQLRAHKDGMLTSLLRQGTDPSSVRRILKEDYVGGDDGKSRRLWVPQDLPLYGPKAFTAVDDIEAALITRTQVLRLEPHDDVTMIVTNLYLKEGVAPLAEWFRAHRSRVRQEWTTERIRALMHSPAFQKKVARLKRGLPRDREIALLMFAVATAYGWESEFEEVIVPALEAQVDERLSDEEIEVAEYLDPLRIGAHVLLSSAVTELNQRREESGLKHVTASWLGRRLRRLGARVEKEIVRRWDLPGSPREIQITEEWWERLHPKRASPGSGGAGVSSGLRQELLPPAPPESPETAPTDPPTPIPIPITAGSDPGPTTRTPPVPIRTDSGAVSPRRPPEPPAPPEGKP